MNSIILNNISMPVLDGCDMCAASEPFFHADRIADFNVLIYVIEGTIYVTEEQTDYTVNAGEMLFLKKGVHHFGKREIPKGTRWYFIHFFFREENGLDSFVPESSPIAQYEPVKYNIELPKKLSGLEGSAIEKKLAEFTEYFHSDNKMKKWNINSVLFELLSSIAFYGKYDAASESIPNRISEYLNRNYKEPFSASMLEQEFYLSYKHMAAVFKKEKGITMQQYHVSLRMNEACRLLKSTLMPIGEIGEAVGYGDMLYFSRCFRKFCGMSPTEYRKSVSNYT